MDTAPGGDSWPFAFHGATGNAENTRIREAAWIARCVGRGASAPLTHDDVIAVAGSVGSASLPPGAVLFGADDPASAGVWIVREGRVELSLGSGRLRVVVGVVRPGDVEGTSRCYSAVRCPTPRGPSITRSVCTWSGRRSSTCSSTVPRSGGRWLSSVAQRLAASHGRLIGMLGRPLPAQLAGLLIDEAEAGEVLLPQRILATMLGVARPSLNKILKDFERRGWVSVGYGSIRLDDPDALSALTGPG